MANDNENGNQNNSGQQPPSQNTSDNSVEKQAKTLSDIEVVPPLKTTIKITDCGFDFWQDRVWILNDTVENKFYYLGRIEHEIISRWYLGSIDKIVETINNETVLHIDRSNVEFIVRFLLTNNLLIVGSKVIANIKKQKQNHLMTFFKGVGKIFYLRLPLINPDKFLTKTLSYAKPFFSQGFYYFIVTLLCIDLYLLASNWGSFTGSLPAFSDWSSILLIGFTLIISKVFHEFGHAYACRMNGGAVPEMGVTFIFFYPLLYTDVTSSMMFDAKQRLIVSTAGLRTEFYLAVIAGFFWFFTPEDNIFKSLLFFIASINWLISIAFNAIPFIKFDGYYILSDYLKIRNLSIRANAIFKYYLRTYLFGIDATCPEAYNTKKFRFFLTFSIMSGIYKIFLFSAILLFLFYIEVVGMVFFILAVGMLLLMPVGRELYNIYLLREKMTNPKRLKITMAVSLVLLIILFLPLRNSIYMPAVMIAQTQRIYTPYQAQINKINVAVNKPVKKGQRLMTLVNPELNRDRIINILNLETEKYYTAGALLTDKARKEHLAKKSEVDYQKTIGRNLKLKSKQLDILAPFDGVVTALKDGIYNNIWLKDKEWVLDIVDFNNYYLHAFIEDGSLKENRFKKGTKMVFIPDRLEHPVCKVSLQRVSNQPVDKIPRRPIIPLSLAESTLVNSNLLLFSTAYGGTINLEADQDNNWVPVDSFYTLELVPVRTKAKGKEKTKSLCKYDNQQVIKGVLKARGQGRSVIGSLYETVRNALVRA